MLLQQESLSGMGCITIALHLQFCHDSIMWRSVNLVVVMIIVHFHYRHDRGGRAICQPGNRMFFPHAILQALGPLPVSLAYDYIIPSFGNSSTEHERGVDGFGNDHIM